LLIDRIGILRLVDEVVWVKMTVNKRMAKSHGYYLQHAKEVCLVGRRGALPPTSRQGIGADVIYSERRGQSQKPEEIYDLIEKLVPGGNSISLLVGHFSSLMCVVLALVESAMCATPSLEQ
jgi:N6-adenosine-specific RNA methylase IME4